MHATPPPPPPAPGPYPDPSPQPWPPAGFLRRAERGRLRPHAEQALFKAARQGKLATLKHLVEEGVDVNAKDYSMTALMWAAQKGKLDCLEYLIAKGAKLDATNDVSAAPPAAAPQPPPPPRRRRSPRVAPPPLTARGAAAVPPQFGMTALILAAGHGKRDCLELLVAKGAKLDARDNIVSATPPARPPGALRPSPSALAARRPCCPAPRRRR